MKKTEEINEQNGDDFTPLTSEGNQIRVFPTACGVTASNKPNITLVNHRNNMPYSLWYHTSFDTKDAALEFLKDLFKDGILDEDIGLDSDGALWLTMDELREVK
jgi:hypothetical protein